MTVSAENINKAREILAKNKDRIRPLMMPRWLALGLGMTPAEWDAAPGGDWKPFYCFPMRRKP